MRIPTKLGRPLATAGIFLASVCSSWAADIKIIANPNIPTDTISARELKSLFLGEKNSLGGVHVQPVLEKGGPAHEIFLREYLERSDDDLQKYYLTLVFTGRGSAPRAESADEIVAYVAKTKGAIEYVSATTETPGVKTLVIGDSAAAAERKLLSRVEPEYPEELQKRSIGGVVRLKLTIAANGSVEKAELLGGNPVLAEAAIAAVAKWKYAPSGARSVAEISIPFDPH